MNFTRNPRQPFVVQGVDLGSPIDKLAPGKWSMLKNTRVYTDGQITTRAGLADDSGAAQAIYTFPGAAYLHSILRVNDSSPESSFGWARFVGDDLGNVYVGQDSASFAAGWNPIVTGFSGQPLSLVPFRPEGGSSSAVYVGDSAQMKEIVFRPQDDFTGGPQVYQIGLPVPNGFGSAGAALPTSSGVIASPASGGAGNLTGTYWWRFVFRNIYTGKRSNPSCPTRTDITPDPVYGNLGLSTGLTLTNEYATMTLPDRVAGDVIAEADIVVDVYRFGGTVFDWHYVGSGTRAANFTDDLPDILILSNPTPPVDALGQFSLNQPFPTVDISRSGTLQFVQPGTPGVDPVYIKASSFDPATPDELAIWNSYLPGTQVIIEAVGGATFAVTFYRFGTDSVDKVAEITEDIPGALLPATDYTYRILSPIRVGVPLRALWGPMGAGNAGLVMFACGDPRQAGTLYWTNPNDPDSCALTNSLEVTSPDEPLQFGMVWSDGRNYLWSTQRAFEIVPDASVPGSFLARQIPHMGGLLVPFASGICDLGDSFAWIGYDGIYRSQGVGAVSMTDDDLLPWFPHDANPGFTVIRGGDTIFPPDQNHLDKWRLAWQDGMLYFDFPPVADAT